MAIYSLSISPISRSDGRSVTRSVAYTTGTRIVCERRGRTFDYQRRRDIVATTLIAPGGRSLERGRLWNAAEAAETRINSREGREFRLALPHELDPNARFALAVSFAQLLVDRYGIVADVAIHAPGGKRLSRDRATPENGDEVGRGPDPRNHHAHIVTTTRLATNVDYVFGAKCRQLDGKASGALETVALRTIYADMCNAALEAAGRDERVDPRSNFARGIDAVPLGKLGPIATDFERRTGKKSARRLDLEAEKAKIEARFAELDAEAGPPEAEPTVPGLPEGTPVVVAPVPDPPVIAPPVIAPPTIIKPVAPPSVPGPSLISPPVIIRPIVVSPPTIFIIAPMVVAPEFAPPAIVRPVALGHLIGGPPVIVEPGRGAPSTTPPIAPINDALEPVSPVIVGRILPPPVLGKLYDGALMTPNPGTTLRVSPMMPPAAERMFAAPSIAPSTGGLDGADRGGGTGLKPNHAPTFSAIGEKGTGIAHLEAPRPTTAFEPDPVRLAAHRDALAALRHDAAASDRARLQALLDAAADTVIHDAIGSSLRSVLDGLGATGNLASAASPPTAAPSGTRKAGIIPTSVSSLSNNEGGLERVLGSATPQPGHGTETHDGGRRHTPSQPSPQPHPGSTSIFEQSEQSLFNLHAAALAFWSFALGDAPDAEHRGRFFRTLRLIAAAIGVGDRVLLAAVTAIRDWIAAGRRPDLVDGARHAGARAAEAMERAVVAGDGPLDLATTLQDADVEMLRSLGEACRVDKPIAAVARPARPNLPVASSPSEPETTREEPIRPPGEAEGKGDGLVPAEPDRDRPEQGPAVPADRGKVASPRRPALPTTRPPVRKGPGLAD